MAQSNFVSGVQHFCSLGAYHGSGFYQPYSLSRQCRDCLAHSTHLQPGIDVRRRTFETAFLTHGIPIDAASIVQVSITRATLFVLLASLARPRTVHMGRTYRTKIGRAARGACYSGKKRTLAFDKNKHTRRSPRMVDACSKRRKDCLKVFISVEQYHRPCPAVRSPYPCLTTAFDGAPP